MTSSPFSRFVIAASIYLLLMWGYVALPSAQLFAVFTALIMSIALYLWVRDTKALLVAAGTLSLQRCEVDNVHSESSLPDSACVAATHLKLDSLKKELTEQYAEFGRDQARLNSYGLGTWHQKRISDAEGGRRRRKQ